MLPVQSTDGKSLVRQSAARCDIFERLGNDIVQNRTVARPKRFELLTPRFVV